MKIRYVTWTDYPRGHAVEVRTASHRFVVHVDMTDEVARRTFVLGPKEYVRLKHLEANYALWKGISETESVLYVEALSRGFIPPELSSQIRTPARYM